MPSDLNWYAIRVKSRQEKVVSDQLRGKGYEEFLPLYWSRRVWSDRVKVLQLPLFSGYLFCRFSLENRIPILETPGIFLIVGRGREPLAIDPVLIANIRQATSSGQKIEPWPRLEIGQTVRIEHGPLAGIQGTLLQHKGTSRLIIGIELMKRAMSIEVEDQWVMPGSHSSQAPADLPCQRVLQPTAQIVHRPR